MCPIISDWRKQPFSSYFRFAKNNRSKSVWTLFQRKRLNNQTFCPVIFGITGPICERALKSLHLLELRPRGHHDWPVMPVNPSRIGMAVDKLVFPSMPLCVALMNGFAEAVKALCTRAGLRFRRG